MLTLLLSLRARAFSTGSIGFFGWGHQNIGGAAYSASLNIVEVGSKERNAARSFKPEASDRHATLSVSAKPCSFTTGNTGYRVCDKVVIGGKKYQVTGTVARNR